MTTLVSPSGSGVTVATAGTPPVGDGSTPILPLHIHLGRLDDARHLVTRYHYSHRMPSNSMLIATWHRAGGLFGESGEAIAAALISVPPTRWSEPVYELSRLVCKDITPRPPLTRFLKGTLALARQRGFDLIVSFADRTFSHHGGIYQAASWKYGGLRARNIDGVLFGGKFVPGRMANDIWGTRSPSRLAAKGVEVQPHFDEGKHLYWKALTTAGAEKVHRLGLLSLPYPKESV